MVCIKYSSTTNFKATHNLRRLEVLSIYRIFKESNESTSTEQNLLRSSGVAALRLALRSMLLGFRNSGITSPFLSK